MLSPSLALELLDRIIKRIHDFVGSLNEEQLWLHFTMVYELIDEIIDFGYPQFTDSERLKNFVTW